MRWVSNAFHHCRCGPCKTIAPVVDQLATIHPTVQFFKLDIDKCKVRVALFWIYFAQTFFQMTKTMMAVSSVPSFVFMNAGKEVSRFSGASQKDVRIS